MSSSNTPTMSSAPPVRPGYVLAMLTMAYMLNFIDRTIIGSLAEPIKNELLLSDAQVGLMSGLAFAIFYTTLGIPIARMAETGNRVTIISIAIAVWSAMTALCGAAQNFAQLFLARVGVGIGEAGCTPPAHSLIADYFPPERRATAYGVYSLGIPLGALFGAIAGGWISQNFGWRAAFLIVGLPGLLLALIMKVSVNEPPRRQPLQSTKPPRLMAVVVRFWRERRLRYVTMANSISAIAGFSMVVFAIPFLLRGTDLSLFQAALGYGLVFGIASFLGTSASGLVADWMAEQTRYDRLVIPGIGLIMATPIYAVAVYSSSLPMMAAAVFIATIIRDFHVGPALGAIQNGFSDQMRARAAAILLLIMNLVGLGLGPMLVGLISDHFAANHFGTGFERCAAAAGTAGCREASFAGLQHALMIGFCMHAVAGCLFLLASRQPTPLVEETI